MSNNHATCNTTARIHHTTRTAFNNCTGPIYNTHLNQSLLAPFAWILSEQHLGCTRNDYGISDFSKQLIQIKMYWHRLPVTNCTDWIHYFGRTRMHTQCTKHLCIKKKPGKPENTHCLDNYNKLFTAVRSSSQQFTAVWADNLLTYSSTENNIAKQIRGHTKELIILLIIWRQLSLNLLQK